MHLPAALWSPELSVGSALLDRRNQAMFERCAAIDTVIATHHGGALSDWMLGLFAQFETLLQEEETELATIDYPELAYHRQLHARARNMVSAGRAQFGRQDLDVTAVSAARNVCSALSVWLMRHILDADRLFLPYIDARFRHH